MPTTTWLLRITCAVMLLGHGWACCNGDMPLRALLWDEALATGPVKALTGMGWGKWVSSMEVDARIDFAIRVQAILFFAFAIAALIPFKRRLLAAIYAFATINLTFLAWLKYHDAGVGIGQFAEHSAQLVTPLVLLLVVWQRPRAACWLASAAIALTFIGHGLFALDLGSQTLWANHPRPGRFTEMAMLCLGFETEAAANRLLVVAGIIDLLAAALLFTRRWPRALALWWMLAWGFLTAVARPWAYFEPTAAIESLNRWIPEALYRVPHFAIPLLLLLALRHQRVEPSAPKL
jgi:hypothetical protein